MPADGLLGGAAGVEEGAGLLMEVGAGEVAEEVVSTFGTDGEAVDTSGRLKEGGVCGAEDTTMAGTFPESVTQKVQTHD